MSDPAHNDVENGETANGRVRSIAVLGRVEICIYDARKQTPPDDRPVIIDGGIGYFKNGLWYSAVGHDIGRDIMWNVRWWTPLLHGDERPNDPSSATADPMR